MRHGVDEPAHPRSRHRQELRRSLRRSLLLRDQHPRRLRLRLLVERGRDRRRRRRPPCVLHLRRLPVPLHLERRQLDRRSRWRRRPGVVELLHGDRELLRRKQCNLGRHRLRVRFFVLLRVEFELRVERRPRGGRPYLLDERRDRTTVQHDPPRPQRHRPVVFWDRNRLRCSAGSRPLGTTPPRRELRLVLVPVQQQRDQGFPRRSHPEQRRRPCERRRQLLTVELPVPFRPVVRRRHRTRRHRRVSRRQRTNHRPERPVLRRRSRDLRLPGLRRELPNLSRRQIPAVHAESLLAPRGGVVHRLSRRTIPRGRRLDGPMVASRRRRRLRACVCVLFQVG
mmetsp:Transcript_9329/g.30332  ORF Transcript_9329/g.30332 Transcript_9329/m.30332 type:complete len:339 (-) Transcript_9329:722-1738(-)